MHFVIAIFRPARIAGFPGRASWALARLASAIRREISGSFVMFGVFFVLSRNLAPFSNHGLTQIKPSKLALPKQVDLYQADRARILLSDANQTTRIRISCARWPSLQYLF
jgi:hypothetical protein